MHGVECRNEYLNSVNEQTEDDIAGMLGARDHCIDIEVLIRGQVRRGYLDEETGRAALDMMLGIACGLERGQHYAGKYRKLARLEERG